MSKQINTPLQLPDGVMNSETTLDINGHIFYVDFGLKKLKPKGIDDDLSQGIPFSVFQDHFNEETNRCEIPYDKKKHEFVTIDYETITEIPEDLILIGFPHLDEINPVEYSISGGWAKEDFQDEETGQKHFVATILKGESNWLEGFARLNRFEQEQPLQETLKRVIRSRKMGRNRGY